MKWRYRQIDNTNDNCATVIAFVIELIYLGPGFLNVKNTYEIRRYPWTLACAVQSLKWGRNDVWVSRASQHRGSFRTRRSPVETADRV